jgi:phosphoglycerate dehydrogenase-like enzyme
MTIRILIASYIEPEHVERMRNVSAELEVIYEPELMAKPRYLADHKGHAFTRTPDQETRWRNLLASADILFDFDQTHLDDLPDLAPQAKWMQTTSSGVARFLEDRDYFSRMPHTKFTNAAGIHAQPLAEFCLMVMIMFNKGSLQVMKDQQAKHWERYAGTDLSNRTLVVVGLGKVGQEVARLGKQFRMHTIGVKRTIKDANLAALNVDELFAPDDLHKVLPKADYLVLIAPHTDETVKMMGETEFNLMPKGAVLVNIGRGALVDEPALVAALESGHIAGAGLDVFEVEPLPKTSPFWEMDNVIISPHSASTTNNENRLITDLFCENLKRYLAGDELVNLL